MATERGRTYYQILDQYLLAVICAEAESYEEALEHARTYRELTFGIAGQLAEFQALLVEAYVALRQTRSRRRASAVAQRAGNRQSGRYRSCWGWHPPMMVRLLTEALDRDIGVAYARELIRIHRLVPESQDIEHWPWPIRVYTLGRFEIQLDGMPLRSEGKAQRKPLELLKAVIALGAWEVTVDKLIDMLWPDPEGGDGQKTFDITVHRLRKLLGFDAAVEVSDRRVSLNRHVVWVDAWALDRTLESLVPAATAVLPRIDLLEAAAPQVMNLYRGPFLAGDVEARWQIAARNRHHRPFPSLRIASGRTLRAWRAMDARGGAIPARDRARPVGGVVLSPADDLHASGGPAGRGARSISPVPADSLGHARHLARAGNRIGASATAGDVTAKSSPHDRSSALFRKHASGSK